MSDLPGNTDSEGRLKCISAAATGDAPGDYPDQDGIGVTDKNGNLMCMEKPYTP